MSKQKAQGTRHESWLVNRLKESGHKAKRLAEGGTRDEGDVEVFLHSGRWVMEAKARSSLNIQRILAAARAKAEAAAGEPVPVAVVWKRLVRVKGLQVRQPIAGERVVVCISMDDFILLIKKEDLLIKKEEVQDDIQ